MYTQAALPEQYIGTWEAVLYMNNIYRFIGSTKIKRCIAPYKCKANNLYKSNITFIYILSCNLCLSVYVYVYVYLYICIYICIYIY